MKHIIICLNFNVHFLNMKKYDSQKNKKDHVKKKIVILWSFIINFKLIDKKIKIIPHPSCGQRVPKFLNFMKTIILSKFNFTPLKSQFKIIRK